MQDLKTEIREEAMRRMKRIEEIFSNGVHVPSEVMGLYGMLSAIAAASLELFFANFGHMELNSGDINDAKQDLGWTPITDFEREVCDLINERCRERQHEVLRPAVIDVRATG